jgi:protease-4
MKKLFRFIGKIIKGIWATISFLRVAVLNLFFIGIAFAIYFSYTQLTATPTVQVREPSALVLNLSGPIVEQRTYSNPMDSFTGSLVGQELPRENVLFEIVETLRIAAEDDTITGLILDLKQMPETNLTKLRYIAKAINEFKSSGKSVYAKSDFYNQSQYYLASYADKIFLAPDGGVLLRGYSAYSLYYKEMLEKLDVSTHIFRVGTYKSAIEPFMLDGMSDAAKESATTWLTQLWGAYVDDVALNRDIDPSTLNPSMDEFLTAFKNANGDLAKLALELNLVDELATRQQMNQYLVDTYGATTYDTPQAISYYDYQTTIDKPFIVDANDIAVVVASGAIMDGQQPRGTVGGDTTAAFLRDARYDDKVKAVVLRVDSPGGSAFASEVIRNEIDALKQAGKPVVVSMSSLAASGGYWISMSADHIIAQPTTLTGSIGIFSVITTFEKGFKNLGITSDGVGTSPFSGIGLANGLNKGASDAMQMGIENGYSRFINLVSEHREMDVALVDSVAQGRVWTGVDALEHGLIDSIGDFDDAINAAATLAELEEFNLYWMEEPLTPVEQFMEEFSKTVSINIGSNIIESLPFLNSQVGKTLLNDASLLESFNDPKGHYAFCLNCQIN